MKHKNYEKDYRKHGYDKIIFGTTEVWNTKVRNEEETQKSRKKAEKKSKARLIIMIFGTNTTCG